MQAYATQSGHGPLYARPAAPVICAGFSPGLVGTEKYERFT
jgi:hypothetical protein